MAITRAEDGLITAPWISIKHEYCKLFYTKSHYKHGML